jgi:hypothetical protein
MLIHTVHMYYIVYIFNAYPYCSHVLHCLYLQCLSILFTCTTLFISSMIIHTVHMYYIVYSYLLYSYNFNPIKNTHLRHVTVHYFSILYNRKPYFFRIGRPDKSVFFLYCTLCKGSNSLIFVICFLELV